MNFRSFADLAATISRNLGKIPSDVDLIAGVPRSGLLAANLVALELNLCLTTVEGLLEGKILRSGFHRVSEKWITHVEQVRHVLILDDSIHQGAALEDVKRLIGNSSQNFSVSYAAVYAAPQSKDLVDFYFEICPMPRMFAWNYMHHPLLSRCCVDLDGVLCCDPTEKENDDGEGYLNFLARARPLRVPTVEIGYVVTSRLEKYRAQTEEWLQRNGVRYRHLIMLDGYDAETRRKNGVHGSFKADVYRKVGAELFIESNEEQAADIAARSGKPVLCTATLRLARPAAFSPRTILGTNQIFVQRVSRKLGRVLKRALADRNG